MSLITKMRHSIGYLVLAGCLSAATGFAQNTNSADIRGIVTDAKGAVVPGASVVLKDIDKGTEKTFTTDNSGLYETGSIVPDSYVVTVTAAGFKTAIRGPIKLDVGQAGLNFQLAVGAVTEEVNVNTDLPLLDTEDGSRTTTLEGETLAKLPQLGADWQNFIKLLPGSSYGFGSGQTASINGNLPYSSVLEDGATVTLPQSSNADVTVFETTAEVKVDANAFSAQYGIGGIIFNQITKGGTSQFHGAAYEYFQNNALNAADYAFGNVSKAAFLRYDNYGFSIGGPIVIPHLVPPGKVFFYFNFDKTYKNGGSSNQLLTVPTDAERAGDFTGMPTVYDYATQVLTYNSQGQPSVTRKSFASLNNNGNKIPAARLSAVALAAQKFFPEPNTPGHPTAQGLPFQNYFVNVPNTVPFTKYFGRLDWDATSRHRITISDTTSDNPAVSYGNGAALCPINCQSQDVSRDNAQVSDVWTINSKLTNEARFGFTDQLNFFSPLSNGKGYPQQLGVKWAVADAFPNFAFNNYLGLGSPSNAVYKEMLFDPSDVVTMIVGRHVLHFGGEFLINRADSTAWGNQNPGSVDFQGYYTDQGLNSQTVNGQSPQTFDPTDYADFLLGLSADWYGNVSPEWGGRLKNPQAFIQDDYKLKPNLTVNIGLRWAGISGWKEVKGNISSFDPTVINPGTDPNGKANTYGGQWYAFNHAGGRDRVEAPNWTTFLPRVGFAYSPKPNTVLRGGIGLYNYTWSQDFYGGGIGSAFGSAGGAFDPSGGIYPQLLIDSDGSINTEGGYGKSMRQLLVTSPTTPDAFNGNGVGYTNYHTPVPEIWQYNLTLQREITNSMAATVAYVGSHGFHLRFPVDINQVPVNQLSVTDITPGMNKRPYPNFTGINGSLDDAISNYNSLQVTVTRRTTHGLSLNASYTYSKFLDSQDTSAGGGNGGPGTYQSSYCLRCNYGPSVFDLRHVFSGSAIYTLPFGHGGMFLNKTTLEDLAFGGWRLSATTRINTGAPFTPVMANNQSYAQAGNQFPNQIGDPRSLLAPNNTAGDPNNGGQQTSVHTLTNWFNKYAFVSPGVAAFGTIHRNSLYGPGYSDVDLSFGKTFTVMEHYKLEIRADAKNFLNHPSFGGPDSAIDDNHPATISYVTNGGRNLQLYGRFSF